MASNKYYVTVDEDGTIRWYKDAKRTVFHRVGGPAVEYTDGTKVWLQNGNRHRDNGPAFEFANGDKRWYQNGGLHRTDGPAVAYANGDKRWYINGEELTEAEFLAATQPVVEMTVADIEKLLGKRVKIIK